MDKYWKEKEITTVKCENCLKKVVPKVVKYENTTRKVCPKCGYTMELTVKPKKLKQREW